MTSCFNPHRKELPCINKILHLFIFYAEINFDILILLRFLRLGLYKKIRFRYTFPHNRPCMADRHFKSVISFWFIKYNFSSHFMVFYTSKALVLIHILKFINEFMTLIYFREVRDQQYSSAGFKIKNRAFDDLISLEYL